MQQPRWIRLCLRELGPLCVALLIAAPSTLSHRGSAQGFCSPALACKPTPEEQPATQRTSRSER